MGSYKKPKRIFVSTHYSKDSIFNKLYEGEARQWFVKDNNDKWVDLPLELFDDDRI